MAAKGEKSVRYPTVNTSPNAPIQLKAREPGLINNYTWNPTVGLSASDRKDPVFRYETNMEYTVRIDYGNGCPVIDTVMVAMRQITPTLASQIFSYQKHGLLIMTGTMMCCIRYLYVFVN